MILWTAGLEDRIIQAVAPRHCPNENELTPINV